MKVIIYYNIYTHLLSSLFIIIICVYYQIKIEYKRDVFIALKYDFLIFLFSYHINFYLNNNIYILLY